jgi:hypothetical protein
MKTLFALKLSHSCGLNGNLKILGMDFPLETYRYLARAIRGNLRKNRRLAVQIKAAVLEEIK